MLSFVWTPASLTLHSDCDCNSELCKRPNSRTLWLGPATSPVERWERWLAGTDTRQ
ncbi:hypothetical protein BKA56DRAFT_568567 [Ilyonectria sp. MPI-CAGE-AT-0026]|nr:hypothetical protein BKA56DRAFT_568567 [Ilyonectria sp. MPI-CAGE-AT-0026]